MKLKRIVSLLLLLALAATLFTACKKDDSKTVTFMVDGDVYITAVATADTLGSLPADPEMMNMKFLGWYLDEELTKPFTADTVLEGDLTVYAKFDYDTITIKEALEIELADGEVSSERYYIRATVDSIVNAQYGSMNISDATGTIYVYGSYSADGVLRYSEMESVPYRGDEVLLYCKLKNFNGEMEINSAWIIDFESKADEFDESKYTEMSINDARDAEKGALIKVDGVVAKITYANGMKPSGFYLVDDSNSIYVYDADAAQRVSEGNKVTVCAVKDYWILDTEANNAEKFGYKGCCQLTDATLVSNDGGSHEFDTSWISESTVKAMMDTPFTTDITTTIFKVTALITRSPQSGYVNYYIDDLDGVTGTYTYTQCNGSDFTWLDKFDGKICTVYLSCINAKSTSTGCVWRVIPVKVVDEGYTFDPKDTPEFAVNYQGATAFEDSYMTGAKVELPTLVSSSILGFEGATLSYSVSDSTLAEIVTEDGKLYFKTLAAGEVTVTITGSYSGADDYSRDITVKIITSEQFDTITVGQAIAAENNTVVTVRGIVGPSVVNKKGAFYLITEDGAIPTQGTNADVFMAGLAIGHEVVIRGTRTVSKDGGGQIFIENAEVLANYYGENDYSTSSFITDKTIEEILQIQDSPEATTNVFTLTATVEKSVSQNGSYTNVTFNVGGLMLYSGGATQYAWLEQFFADGETSATLTIELALCDWNAKGLKGCVLSVITEEGKVYNTFNFN